MKRDDDALPLSVAALILLPCFPIRTQSIDGDETQRRAHSS